MRTVLLHRLYHTTPPLSFLQWEEYSVYVRMCVRTIEILQETHQTILLHRGKSQSSNAIIKKNWSSDRRAKSIYVCIYIRMYIPQRIPLEVSFANMKRVNQQCNNKGMKYEIDAQRVLCMYISVCIFFNDYFWKWV